MFRVEMLPAYEGDSLWVTYGEASTPRCLVIDAGRKGTYKTLVDRLIALERLPELFVLTHIDDDHIFGALPLFADGRINQNTFKDIWYNGYAHLDIAIAHRPPTDLLGPQNGEIFAALLLKGHHPWNEAFDHGATVVVPETGELPRIHLDGGMTITLLAPGWEGLTALKAFWEEELENFKPGDAEAALEIFSDQRSLQPDVLGGLIDVEDLLERPYNGDSAEPNGSSIAFLAEYEHHAALFTGDAHPAVLERSITRLLQERSQSVLPLDALKISHHGSKNNTSTRLLELLDCHRFLISTNGARHEHPDQEAIARIVYRDHASVVPTELYFNYRTKQNQVWDDDSLKDDWNFITYYPPQGSLASL